MANFDVVLVCAFLWLTFSGGILQIYSWVVNLGPLFWRVLALSSVTFLFLFTHYLLDLVFAKITHRQARQRVYRPRRGAQVPFPGVSIQGGPMNPQVLQMHEQPQLNGVPIQGDPMNPQVLQMHAQPQLNGRLPNVQNHQRDIGLRQLHRPGFAEDGMGAPPLRRSERLRAKKKAEERVHPVLRRSARLQAKKGAEERKAQNLRRVTRSRAY